MITGDLSTDLVNVELKPVDPKEDRPDDAPNGLHARPKGRVVLAALEVVRRFTFFRHDRGFEVTWLKLYALSPGLPVEVDALRNRKRFKGRFWDTGSD